MTRKGQSTQHTDCSAVNVTKKVRSLLGQNLSYEDRCPVSLLAPINPSDHIGTDLHRITTNLLTL